MTPALNVFSTNFASDQLGTPDTRPGTWGNAGVIDFSIPFTNVPAGKRVHIMRIYGDFLMWAHGACPDNTQAGGLTGLLKTSGGQSPFVGPGLGAFGCFFYIQSGCASEPSREPFDFDVSQGGLLDTDNKMTLRQAVFLNNTGLPIHMETTMVVEFQYE